MMTVSKPILLSGDPGTGWRAAPAIPSATGGWMSPAAYAQPDQFQPVSSPHHDIPKVPPPPGPPSGSPALRLSTVFGQLAAMAAPIVGSHVLEEALAKRELAQSGLPRLGVNLLFGLARKLTGL